MEKFIIAFPAGAILLSTVAFLLPEYFVPLSPYIVMLLGLVMFGMGITLTAADFLYVLKRPQIIFLGLLLQFLLMPLFAWLVSMVLDLPLLLSAGLILVGACPGGTASNVICYLAKGDVALSITLTSCSTMLAVIMTPFLTWLYIGQEIDVPAAQMFLDIFKVIIVPVVLGVLMNYFLGEKLAVFKQWFPVMSMLAIMLIIAIIVASNKSQLAQIVLPVILAVFLHNGLGLLGGYWIPKCLGYDKTICKTLAIETGMQNSGLGVALAGKYFSAMAALPGAIFSIWHNISGAILAGIWSRQNTDAGHQ
jgi:BASS family bile acid:Na+ symporter